MAFEFLDRDGYLELRMYGVVDGSTVRGDAPLAPLASAERVLVDTTDVTEVTADVMWLGSLVRQGFAQGPSRTALVASDDVIFGTFRQVQAYRGEVPDGARVEFFRTRDEAIRWLLLPG